MGIKLMNGNVEVDERGVLHMPLYAPCFFEDAGTEDFPPPTSAERINREYEIRRGASGD